MVLKSLSIAYYYHKDFTECISTINQYKKYRNKDYIMNTLQVQCYLIEKQYQKIIPSSLSLMDGENVDVVSYLERIINKIESAIYKNEFFMNYNLHPGNKLADICELQDILEEHQEMLGQALSDKPKVLKSIMEEYNLDQFDEEIRSCLIPEDGTIHLSNIKSYIENLNIPLDETMLLYLSAAKVLFENKFSKHALKYMKIVEHEKNKSPFVKEHYDRCIRNKRLYLNK